MKYGIQLYSLRDIGSKHGLEELLKMVSKAGYDGVEFAGFYGHTPLEVKALCEKYNIIPFSAHLKAEEVEANLEYIKTLGFKIVFTPGVFKDGWDEKYPEQLALNKKAYEMLKEIGVEFGYHNHAHEYVDGKENVNKLTNDVKGMKVELDIGWATFAGLDVAYKMQEYEGKLKAIHVKELGNGNPHTEAPPVVGEGVVDMVGAFKEAKRQGIEWAILEVEQFNIPETEYIEKSIINMKKW